MPSNHRHVIAVLRHSHDHLVSVVGSLPAGGLTAQSYCDDWTVAQALSHLGSGAEIGLLQFEATLAGDPPPEQAQYQEIWARWDARSPEEMASEAIISDERYVARLENTDDALLDAFSMPWFGGMTLDAEALAAVRLGEHALHTWDVESSVNPGATLASDATEVLLAGLPDRITRTARGERPAPSPTTLAFEASDPDLAVAIEIGDEVSATPPSGASTTVKLPSEALIRLSMGRMDEAHTPAGTAIDGALNLEEVRALFPGY